MRKTKIGFNVTLTVIYVLIVVTALTIITLAVPTFVGNYFLQQRLEEQKNALNDCALDIIPYVESSSADNLYRVLSKSADNQNGRILFVDTNGIVQVDTFCHANGTVLNTKELSDVLSEKTDFTYGYHKIQATETSVTRNNGFMKTTKGSFWAGYYVQTVLSQGTSLGAVILVAPIDDIVSNINSISWGLVFFSILFTLIIAGFTFYISNNLTLSLRRFNRAIGKMSSGDFSVRVDEAAFSDFSELAKGFNMMAAQLENLDNSRNQFVSDASHELKTPLASMKILSESLLTSPDVPKEMYLEFLGDINSEIDRLSLVINDLLTLVKADKGLDSLIITQVDFGTLIKKVVTSVSALAKKKHITISYQYSDVTLMGDELRLRQVCTNLIDNAVKYSTENTTISVDLARQGSNAVFTVSDQGIGISEEHLPHLFERFYRVDKARSRKAGGTGLGLSIVKQIVEQHGGIIEVSSKLGEGTTFTVKIPIKSEE